MPSRLADASALFAQTRSGSAVGTPWSRPRSTVSASRPKSARTTRWSLPAVLAASEQSASLRSRGKTRASSPGRAPQSPPLRTSPPAVLHDKIDPCATVTRSPAVARAAAATDGGGADGTVVVDVAAGTPGSAVPRGVTALAGGAADSITAAEGPSGTLGPRRTPARRGQATPMTNPATAIAPTPIHEGRSAPEEGTCTVSGPSALRRGIEGTITIGAGAKRKTLLTAGRRARGRACRPGSSGRRRKTARCCLRSLRGA